MNAGLLDRRITLKRATVTTNEFNEPVYSWSTLATVSAAKLDLSDRERLAFGEMAAEIITRFRIRWSSTVSDLNPKDKLVHAGRTYEIYAVKEMGRHVGLEITAVARADK